MGVAASIKNSENNLEYDRATDNNNISKLTITYNVESKEKYDKGNSVDNINTMLLNESETSHCAFVVISKSGFSKTNLNIECYQMIIFVWDSDDSNSFNVVQVIHDGEFYRPVIGGIHSGPVTNKGHFEFKFKMIGNYKFVSAGLKCTPLNINVSNASNIMGVINNDGFIQNIFCIYRDQEITWTWNDCDPPISVYQVTKCKEHLGLKVVGENYSIPSNAGQFVFTFKTPGIYYFIGSNNFSKNKLCVVEVKDIMKDYLINVTDVAFEPSILVLEEGDRVWYSWDKSYCKNLHCVYEVLSPERNASSEESYKPVKDGFRWPKPTKCGLLSHVFTQMGVYHFSDHNYQETAEYTGTIIVKPRPVDHYIEIKKDGFDKDIYFAKTGDRIWWNWDTTLFSSTFNLVLDRFCTTPATKDFKTLSSCNDDCKLMDRAALEICNKTGFDFYAPLYIGVYHFRSSSNNNTVSTFSLVVCPGIQNYTVYANENGFEPQLLTVHPYDRIWWIWQTPKLSLNIEQVNSDGKIKETGFSSGGAMESPSSFMHSLQKPGVFYYSSQKFINKCLGIIIVKLQPSVHEVQVSCECVNPDPIIININDIVVWIFESLKNHKLVQIKDIHKISDAYRQSCIDFPRRCDEKGFENIGMYHFSSKSFLFPENVNKKAMNIENYNEHMISTVIVDNINECSIIRVTSYGFFPQDCTILQFESLLWTWKNNSNEEHNIIYITPDDEEDQNILSLNNTLNSGKPEKNSSFFFTFDRPGLFYVASIGAPGYICTITVLKNALKAPKPYFEDNITEVSSFNDFRKDSVLKGHIIYIKKINEETALKDLKIYYSLNGTTPLPHNESVKIYNFKTGIILEETGIFYIKALSVARDMLFSDVSISRRFVVLNFENNNSNESESFGEYSKTNNKNISHENWLWYNCIPYISVTNFVMGNIYIKISMNSEKSSQLIQSYNVYINGINYYGDINSTCHLLVLQGFLSTKQYDICLTANSMERLKFIRQVSNHLNVRIPPNNEIGGPYLSCYRAEVENKISLLWRNISEYLNCAIKIYQIIIDDEPSDSFIEPLASSPWCKISFEDCIINREYKFQVIGIAEDENIDRFYSNELFIRLPLNSAEFTFDEKLIELELNNNHLPHEINCNENEYIFISEVDDNEMLNFTESETQTASLTKLSNTKSKFTKSTLHDSEETMSGDSLSDTTINPSDSKSGGNYDTSSSKADIYDQEVDLDSNVSLISHNRKVSKSMSIKSQNGALNQNKSYKSKLINKNKISKFIKFGGRNKVASIDDKNEINKLSRNMIVDENLSNLNILNVKNSQKIIKDKISKDKEFESHLYVQKSSEEINEKVSSYLSHLETLQNEGTFEYNKHNIEKDFNSIKSDLQENNSKLEIDVTDKPWNNKFKILSNTNSAFLSLYKQSVKKTSNSISKSPISSKSDFEIEIKDDSKSEVTHLTTSLYKEKPLKLFKTVAQPTISMNNFSYLKLDNQENDSFNKYNNHPLTTKNMPFPIIEISQISITEIIVKWTLNSDIPKHLKIHIYNLQITGLQFNNAINSDLSYFDNENVTHIWNVANDCKCMASGLVPRVNYLIHVSATFILSSKQSTEQINELSTYSEKVNYRLSGPPQPPLLEVKSIDIYQVILQWDVKEHDNEDLKSFYIKFNNQKREIKVPIEEKHIIVDNIIDGQYLEVYVYAENGYGKSEKSNVVSIKTCPKPISPIILSEPTFNHGESIISWTNNNSLFSQNFQIIYFRIFMDDMWHSDIMANISSDTKNNKYTFVFQNLEYDISHEIKIYSVAAASTKEENVVYCYSHSNFSTPILITGFKPPEAAILNIETMNTKGILLSWDCPYETDECHVIGYKILKNGLIYGTNMIPSSVNSIWIKDIMLGSRVELQLLTLTNTNDVSDIPSSKIVIHYTGLVSTPTRFEVESVNGFGAVLVWSKQIEKKHHFNSPDHYQITWWNSSNTDNSDIRSLSTKDSMIYITDLLPGTNYVAVLEGRSVNNFKEIYEEKHRSCFKHKITLSSDPVKLNFKTSLPPSPPKNLSILSTSCSSIALQWDSPIEHGSEIVFLSMLYHENCDKSLKYFKVIELTPDAKKLIINNLLENTEYNFVLLAITQEYFLSLPSNFKKDPIGKLQFNEDGSLIGDTSWVVTTSLQSHTSGTVPPRNLSVIESEVNKIKIEWTLPSVNGSNRLLSQVIRITEKTPSTKHENSERSSICINVDKNCHKTELDRLLPATLYRIDIEAVVSIKTILTYEKLNGNFETDDDNRRTTHYPSKTPLFARTKTNSTPPQQLACSKIIGNTIYINWQQPLMYTTIATDSEGCNSSNFIRHRLEAYRVYVNNKLHATLKPNITSVKLTKCKLGKNYIKISSLISPEYMPIVDLVQLFSNLDENISKVLGLDESFSEELVVTICTPTKGSITSLISNVNNNKGRYEIELKWEVSEFSDEIVVKQFNVSCFHDNSIIKQVLDRTSRMTKFTDLLRGYFFTLQVDLLFLNPNTQSTSQKVQIYLPDRPGPPILSCRSLEDEIIRLEWTDIYVSNDWKIKSFQVYINDSSVAKELDSYETSAVIPLKNNNHYKIVLCVRISALNDIDFTEFSNPIFVSTGPKRRLMTQMEYDKFNNMRIVSATELESTGNFITLNTTNITDTTVSLIWTIPESLDDLIYCYQIKWKCIQGFEEQKVVITNSRTSNCEIENLIPGLNYSFSLLAFDITNNIIEKSKQLLIEMKAILDAPNLQLKASNFSYATICWTSPKPKGNVKIKGFQVYINGVFNEEIDSNKNIYTYYNGQPCHQYSFQCQAISFEEKYNSKSSNSVKCIWPGCLSPPLTTLCPMASNSIRVSWNNPTLSEGAKIKHFRITCCDSESGELIQAVNFIHPESRESEIFHIKFNRYIVRLETYLHGAPFPYLSEPLIVQPEIGPKPPIIQVKLLNVDDRISSINKLNMLVNEEDAIMRCVNYWGNPIRQTFDEQRLFLKASTLLQIIQDDIDKSLYQISQNEDYMIAELKWSQQQSLGKISVTGYKVLVDGKYYGRELDATCKSILIKLNVDSETHKIAMVSVSNKPRLLSDLSNIVEVLTDMYPYFRFFCHHEMHLRSSKILKCPFALSMSMERNNISSNYNPEFSIKISQCPNLNLHGNKLNEISSFPIFTRSINCVLFWMPNCENSIRFLNNFISFAIEEVNKNFTFSTIAYINFPEEIQSKSYDTNTFLSKLHRKENMQHYYCLDNEISLKDDSKIFHNAIKILDIQYVPYIILIDNENNIVYRGRYCADDYSDIKNYLSIIIQKAFIKYSYDPLDDLQRTRGSDNFKTRYSKFLSLESQMTSNTSKSTSYIIKKNITSTQIDNHADTHSSKKDKERMPSSKSQMM